MNSEHYVLFGLIATGRDDASAHSIALALFAVCQQGVGGTMDADAWRRYVLNGCYPSSKDVARTIYLLNVSRDDDAFPRRIRQVTGGQIIEEGEVRVVRGW